MLTQLHIQNYAIITEITISFSEGLTIITGETGAGKSILVGALSLILGDRADSSMLMDKQKKCFIEGIFKNDMEGVKSFLENHELDAPEELVIRREISPNGKSRAFINDTPVNLGQLRELSVLLVDLHQQFDTLELGDNDFQREVIDALASNVSTLQQYLVVFKRYQADLRLLENLKLQQATANKELDYNTFLYTELDEAGFKENELEEIDASLKLMNNAEGIKSTLGKVYFELQESELPLVQQIKSLSNQLLSLGDFDSSINDLVSRMHASQVELQDIADEVERLNNSVHFEVDKIERMNDRLSIGYKLFKKHGVNSTAELLSIQQDLSQKLEKLTTLESQIAQMETALKLNHESALKIASKMTASRQKQVMPFEEKVNALLAQVGMPNARIKVGLTPLNTLTVSGSDTIEFLFDANKSNRFEPLRKVASGGELSRLMLSIKSLVARSVHLPTLIFDEIDSGISGEAAKQVGIILKSLSRAHQVISITHQPQIAAKANAHYFVFKDVKADKIVTSIRLLNADERISAIATMLSGEKPTAAAFENAREMIDSS